MLLCRPGITESQSCFRCLSTLTVVSCRENVFEVMARKQAEAASPSEASEPTTSRKQQKVSTRLYCVSRPGLLVSHLMRLRPLALGTPYAPPSVSCLLPPSDGRHSSSFRLTGAAGVVQRAGRTVSRQAEGRLTTHRHHRRPPQHGRLYYDIYF